MATKVLRPIGHEDRLSMVEHLDELRSRLIVCVIALTIAFVGCFLFNHSLLALLNRALPSESSRQGLAATARQTANEAQGFALIAKGATALEKASGLSPAGRAAAAQIAKGAFEAERFLPKSAPQKEKPLTLGVGEPFMTTLKVCAYFALL